MEEMKACPYCGCPKGEIFPTLARGFFAVRCAACHMYGPHSENEDCAVERWNTLPRRLRWTKEWPQDYHPGHYYLFCFPPSKTSICRYVDVPPDELKSEMIRDWPHLSPQEIENIEWAGPIPEPE